MCDRIPVKYVITNTGTGYACDIKITDVLPKGLMASDGSSKVLFTLDMLGPGQSKEFSKILDSKKPGRYSSKASVSSRTAGSVESNMPVTMIRKPELVINESCPADQYIGRTLTYDITITNNGDGIAKDAIIEATVPENAKFVNSTAGGHYTHSSPGKVTWNVGTLMPRSSKKVSMSLNAGEMGTLTSRVTAKAYCADMVSTTCKTVLSGIPAILLEVIDVSDPVRLGQKATYVIKVTNQGSATATNVQISCMLEKGMEYVSSSGATTALFVRNMATFAALPSLAPKASTQFRVKVKAVSEGDMRFKVIMNSDQLSRSVEETEATYFYK